MEIHASMGFHVLVRDVRQFARRLLMRRKSKNEKVAEDIVRSLRFANSREFKNISDDSLKGIILSVLKLWYKPVRKKEIDNSWKETRDQCS